MSRTLKAFSNWKSLVFVILIFIVVDLIVTFVFGAYIRSYVRYIFGSTNKETFAALLFFEGAFLLGLGGWIASGYSESKIIQKDNPAAAGYMAEKLFPQRKEYRQKQISTGVILIIAGIAMLAIAYLTHLAIP